MDFLNVILTSLLSVLALFVIAKIMGHKQMAQLDFFDYISGITVGSIAAELATELEEPWKPLTALVIYGGISVLLSLITHHFPKSRKFINGSPTILMDNGKLYRQNLKKANLDLSEFMVLCRERGYFDLNDIQTAIFEHDGKLTVLPVSQKRPATPADMGLNPPAEHIGTEVIMDGRILDENLKRMGLNSQWLDKQLKAQGYHSAKDIFLGVCDQNQKLSLFAITDEKSSRRSG
ncbi:MAG: DUF421 domain-containing protein [Clostridia bacterium]|nr:DUF421 domain-containing protein [Clostridia bacterium]